MLYKAFHTDATVLVYEDGSVTVGLYESDREKAAELYKAFEDLPPELRKESEIGLFTSITALSAQVFTTKRKP